MTVATRVFPIFFLYREVVAEGFFQLLGLVYGPAYSSGAAGSDEWFPQRSHGAEAYSMVTCGGTMFLGSRAVRALLPGTIVALCCHIGDSMQGSDASKAAAGQELEHRCEQLQWLCIQGRTSFSVGAELVPGAQAYIASL